MKRCWKARPHDLEQVLAEVPEMIELHATSEDLAKDVTIKSDLQLAVHFPEYDGQTLMDPACLDEAQRLKASNFYQRCLDKTRDWGLRFRGTPKAIIHPGGWSSEPMRPADKTAALEQFGKTMGELNAVGVDFLVENMPPFPWFYGGQWNCNFFMEPRECRDVCMGMGWGFCFDACHAALWCRSVDNAVTLEQYAMLVAPITAHAHISGAKGKDGEGVNFDEGDVDMAPILRRLAGRNIGVSLEIWQGHKDGYAAFKKGWRLVDEMLAVAT